MPLFAQPMRICIQTLLTAAATAGAIAAPPAPARAQDPRPNIVLIVADDLAPQLCNFDPEGRGRGFTPALDALAAGGVMLSNLHSPSPICTPSRFSIMTGRYASRATNLGFLRDTQRHGGQTAVAFNTHLDPDDNNLPKRLRDAGYTTGAVGKNHVFEVPGHERLAYTSSASDPETQRVLKDNAQRLRSAYHAAGFDYAQALYYGNPDADGIRELAMHNQEWITQAARRFIAENRARPFFLYMATTIPHGPHEAKRSWKGDPRVIPTGRLDAAPDSQSPRATIPKRLRDAGIESWNCENVLWLDDAVNAVITELEQQGVKNNTIIVFLSDHGTEAKGSVYARGTRTVGLIWRDGGFAVGPVANQAFALPDLAPTILGWAGATFDEAAFDGKDFGPVLNLRTRRRPVPTNDPQAPYSHLTIVPGGADAEQVSINKHPAYFASDQLYDLSVDPHEQHNLAADPAYADQLAEMQRLLRDYVETLPGHFAEFGREPVHAEVQP